jgi:hypothetical protein
MAECKRTGKDCEVMPYGLVNVTDESEESSSSLFRVSQDWGGFEVITTKATKDTIVCDATLCILV